MRVLRRTFDGLGALFPEWVPLPGRQRALTALADMDAIIYGLVEARGSVHEQTIDGPFGSGAAPRASTRTGDGRDLLSTLSAAVDDEGDHARMSRKQLRDELVTLFLAGHETTSHALSWTWHLLSTHPEVEAKLYEELSRVLGGRDPTWSDLERLPYAEQVLAESMRLYPPAYVIPRVANVDTELGGYTIPKGADVVMWIYHTHHDARWFPNPERFDPERFSAARRKQLPPCAYVPFGAGTRTCIGKQFALMEALLIIATTAQRFRLRAVPGARVERDMSVTLAPRDGLKMRVQKRAAATDARSPMGSAVP
jgi:cytochrome P450